MNKSSRLLFSCLFLAAACSSQPLDPDIDRNAVISEPNEKAIRLVRESLEKMLNGAQTQITENAFTENSLLVIHQSQLTGRDLGSSYRFRLIKNIDDCFMIYENTGAREIIPELNCIESN